MLLERPRLKETAVSLQAPSDIAGYSPPGNTRGRERQREAKIGVVLGGRCVGSVIRQGN